MLVLQVNISPIPEKRRRSWQQGLLGQYRKDRRADRRGQQEFWWSRGSPLRLLEQLAFAL